MRILHFKNACIVTALFLMPLFVVTTYAGDLQPPATPDDPASAMHTMDNLYDRLDTGAAGTKRGTSFSNPIDPPSPTGQTLDDVMNKMPAVDTFDGASPYDVACGKKYWGLREESWGLQQGLFGSAIYYHDADADQYGNPESKIIDCQAPGGYVRNSRDCDDTNAAINPAATEVCDDIDNNCDGRVDEGLTCCNPDGTYVLETPINYSCRSDTININVSRLIFHTDGTVIVPLPDAYDVQLNGTSRNCGFINASGSDTGLCVITHTLSGVFENQNIWHGQYKMTFSGLCFGCSNQTLNIRGQRQ